MQQSREKIIRLQEIMKPFSQEDYHSSSYSPGPKNQWWRAPITQLLGGLKTKLIMALNLTARAHVRVIPKDKVLNQWQTLGEDLEKSR